MGETALTVEETRKIVAMACGQLLWQFLSDVMKKQNTKLKCPKRSTLVGTVSRPLTNGQFRRNTAFSYWSGCLILKSFENFRLRLSFQISRSASGLVKWRL
jgi:hypothetical protein